MRKGKGETDRRGGRRKGGQEPALPIKNRPRAPARKRQFFSIQNTWKRFQHFIRLVDSCCSLALIYLVVSLLRALDGGGGMVVWEGSCLQLLGGIVSPEWQWHQLGHMQVCISLQTNNKASTMPLKVFYRPDALPAAQPTASKH